MHRDSVEWNLGRWGPTAPESRVLLDGAKGSGAEAFKLAVLESVARRILAVTGETDLSDKEAPTGLLHSGTVTRPTGNRPLDAIQEIFDEARAQEAPQSSGVYVKEISRAARRRYGSLDGYVETEVLPALEQRGLYERRRRNVLWVFPVTRWELTRSGEAARAQLKHNRKLGEEHFGDWVSRDPERAYSFLGLAGSSLLLMEALHPELRNLQDVDDDDYYGGGITYPPGAPGSSGEIYPDALPDLEGALSAQGSWSDGVWGDSSSSTHGGDSSGGGWFDGGGFDGGGGGGFDGGGGGGGF